MGETSRVLYEIPFVVSSDISPEVPFETFFVRKFFIIYVKIPSACDSRISSGNSPGVTSVISSHEMS